MDRVTRADAARALALDRATITRLVQKNPALLDDEGRVSVDEVRALRDAVLNPKLQTRGAGAASPHVQLNDNRNRTESAKAETAELDLAERLSLTLRRDDVEEAIAAAGDLLRQTGFQMARDNAERIAACQDVRETERALEDFVRTLLERGANAMALAIAEPGSAHAS